MGLIPASVFASPTGALLTVSDVCEELGISRSTFYDWKAKGRVPRCFKLPDGELRVRRSDFDEWFASLEGGRLDADHLRRPPLEHQAVPRCPRHDLLRALVRRGRGRQKRFDGEALADGFRSDLVAAARKGEAFDVESGLPVSMLRAIRDNTSWYALAFQYADLKWPTVAATTRRTHAEALTAISTTAAYRPARQARRQADPQGAVPVGVQHRTARRAGPAGR